MLLKNKRIVYIEDDLRNRKLVELLVTAEGADIWFERWGTPGTALAIVMGYQPLDLILLDLMFTRGYDGYDIYAALRKQSEFDSVPIVMVSAADAAVEIPKARRLGLTSYIAKPIDSDLFAQQLKDIMDGHAIWVNA
ncbi:MAG: response regulator [Anaerolineae bacterium]|nr:response regulator [Anaerolineae bacterium]